MRQQVGFVYLYSKNFSPPQEVLKERLHLSTCLLRLGMALSAPFPSGATIREGQHCILSLAEIYSL